MSKDFNAYRADFTAEMSQLGIERRARALRAEASAHFFRALFAPVAKLGGYLTARMRRNAAIHRLSRLDDRLLADIGVRRSGIRYAIDNAPSVRPMTVKAAGDFNASGQVAQSAPANADSRIDDRTDDRKVAA